MAKSTVATLPVVNADEETITIHLPANWVAKYKDFTLTAQQLNTANVMYQIQYGFAKSLQDSVAGLVKAVTTETDSAKRKELAVKAGLARSDEYVNTSDEAWVSHAEAIAEAIVAQTMQKRFESILEGPPSTKAGAPRARGIDKVMRDIAIEKIKAGILANPKLKLTMPKGEALNNTIAKVLAKHSDAIRADAERRMSIEGVDISDLVEV